MRLTALTSLLLLFAATACDSSDGTDATLTPPRLDIVTFEGNTDDGRARLALVGPDDNGTTLLTASRAIDTATVDPGDRILAYYTPGKPDIRLADYAPVNTLKLRAASREVLDTLSNAPVYVIAVWRTGTWINLRSRLPYTPEIRTWALVVDEQTVEGPVARARIVHRLPDGVDPERCYEFNNYTSFDISALWKRTGVEELRIGVDNSNLTSETEFIFRKQQ